MECFTDFPATSKSDSLTCAIIYDIIYVVNIYGLMLTLQDNGAFYLYNKQNNTRMFGNKDISPYLIDRYPGQHQK